MLFLLTRAAVPRIRADQKRRIDSRPHLRPLKQRIKNELAPYADAAQALSRSADAYMRLRGNSSLFVRFDRTNLALESASASAVFVNQDCSFTDEWTSTLLARPITGKRLSVHVPNIWRAEAELADDRETERIQVNPVAIGLVTLPCLSESSGSLLLTPLGLEMSDNLGHGFIYEYQHGEPFSPQSIQDARALSAVFVLEIAERLAREYPEVG